MPRPSQPPCFDHPNNTGRRVQTMQLFIMQFFPTSCHFITLRSKYSPRYPPELYSLIKLRKPRFNTFKIYALFAGHDHCALRLPPYHPDLNPTELIWASIKAYVAGKNVSLSRWCYETGWGKVQYRYKVKNGARGATMPVSANRITCGWNLLLTTFQDKL
jgi:hypothetical protein